MQSSQRKTKLLWLLPPLAWMTLIFLFSAMPSDSSTRQSSTLADMLVSVAGRFIFLDQAARVLLSARLEPVLRKLAHMSEYAVLFILWRHALKSLGSALEKASFGSALICILYAASDELHQLFVPGRSGMVMDVGIDSLGVLMAFTVLFLMGRKRAK